MSAFSVIPLAGLPEVRAGDDLPGLVAAALPPDAGDGDIVVVAHKVVSKAEGRVRNLSEVKAGDRARALAAPAGKDPRAVQVVLDEAAEVLRAERGVLICVTRHGFVCANAGVDASNAAAPDELILLPADPDASARAIRAGVEQARGVRPGVIVGDSFGRAWRMGQTDVAVGAAGVTVIDDWRGRADRSGRELRATAVAAGDAIAGAADLARAKDSYRPAVLVRGLERLVTRDDGPGTAPLRRAPADDLFR